MDLRAPLHARQMNDISLSVALVTRNRPASLERTLRSLQPQRAHVAEVIISDDSDKEYSSQVEQIAQNYDCEYLTGPRNGLYANRNQAALACRGTHIRSMDDDHEFPDGHFASCIEAIRSDAESIWIIGEHYPNEKSWTVPPYCPGQLVARGYSVGPPNPQDCWAISDGASIFPREIFDRGIRYVEGLKFGASYLEFGSRLHWLGYRIRQLLTTYVIHHYDPAARSFMDAEANLTSEFFAMLCHSWIYQPRATNKALSIFEVAKQFFLHRNVAGRALEHARELFREHRKHLKEFVRA